MTCNTRSTWQGVAETVHCTRRGKMLICGIVVLREDELEIFVFFVFERKDWERFFQIDQFLSTESFFLSFLNVQIRFCDFDLEI